MKYNTAFPYFPDNDIDEILMKFKEILKGNGLLTMGPYVSELENQFSSYIGTNYCVATNSCTSALEISLRAIGITQGDEVIVPVQTYFASGSCIAITGATPVFCDTDHNFMISFDDLEKKVTDRTKAVIIVHYGGLIHQDIFEIKQFLEKNNVILIEDAAHAHGAAIHNKKAGSLGDIGCFSFYSTKIMTTGEGGMITTNNKEFFEISSSLRNRGLDINADREIFTNIGSNRRMTEIQALLGLYQLKRLNMFVEHRNAVAQIYRDKLSVLKDNGIVDFQNYPDYVQHSYWRFPVFLKKTSVKREQLRDELLKHEIKIDWAYDPLLHLQPAFQKLYKTREGTLPEAEKTAKTHVCLPIHYLIKEKDAHFIAEKTLEVLNA